MTTQLDWPSDLGTGKIIGRFVNIYPDSEDEDYDPDIITATEVTVQVVPRIRYARYRGEIGTMLAFFHGVTGVVGSDGLLYTAGHVGSPDHQGLVLPANDNVVLDRTEFSYNITIRHPKEALTFDVYIETDDVIDLVDVVPEDSSGGVVTIIDESIAIRAKESETKSYDYSQLAKGFRDQALEYRDQTEQTVVTGLTSNGSLVIPVDKPYMLHYLVTGNTTFTLPTPGPERAFTVTLDLTMDSVGGHSISFGTTVNAAYGVTYKHTGDPNTRDKLHCMWDGTRWDIFVAAQKLGEI